MNAIDAAYPSSIVSAAATDAAPSVTMRCSDVACTVMFSAKKRASFQLVHNDHRRAGVFRRRDVGKCMWSASSLIAGAATPLALIVASAMIERARHCRRARHFEDSRRGREPPRQALVEHHQIFVRHPNEPTKSYGASAPRSPCLIGSNLGLVLQVSV
jgi:hypothetical protein